MTDLLWRSSDATPDAPVVHALVVGVSAYDHLTGGAGHPTLEPLLAGLGQLSAAATSACRVAVWMRDHFEYPGVRLGSVRLLASPSLGELPLPDGLAPAPATYDNVRAAVAAWRREARSGAENVTLLYVAGHGIQTSSEGGILLLQDAGHPDSLTPLERAVDVASVRRGMKADPGKADTATPAIQYYFYDACRITPSSTAGYVTVPAGVSLDEPRGAEPATSYVVWGSRSRDFALADAATRTTLFSKAFIDVLESRAPTDPDGRTIRLASFGMTLEAVVAELANSFGEQQQVVPGGAGPFTTPVCRRPEPATAGDDRGRAVAPLSAWRPVVVRTSTGARMAVTIVDATGAAAADGMAFETIDLPPGAYTATVLMPWGGSVHQAFSVGEAAGEVVVEVVVPEVAPGDMREAPRLDRQLGLGGGGATGWCLRFLTWTPAGLAFVPGVAAPAVEVDDVSEGSVAMLVHANGAVRPYAQVRADDGRSLVVALPITSEFEPVCWLHVRVTNDALGAVMRFRDGPKDAVAGYLAGGRADHAVALAPSAESLLFSKLQDPIGAAIGGYSLLRLNELDRMHDWADNLGRIFDWLPDGAVIAGELAARRGDDAAAASWFAQAAERGLPVFTEGLSLLANRVPQLLADPDVGADVRQALAAVSAAVVTLSPAAEFGALATTLRADPDQGALDAEHGWRRFVHASLPDDPRDFWRQP